MGWLKCTRILKTDRQLFLCTLKTAAMCSSSEKCNIYPTMTSAIIATFILLICSIVKRSSPSPTGNIIISPATSPSVTTTTARSLVEYTETTATSEPTIILSTLFPLKISWTSFSPSFTRVRYIMSIIMEAATTATYSTIKKWSVILLQIAPTNLISSDQTTIRSVPKCTLVLDWNLINGDC